jgi:hypothetical protein
MSWAVRERADKNCWTALLFDTLIDRRRVRSTRASGPHHAGAVECRRSERFSTPSYRPLLLRYGSGPGG